MRAFCENCSDIKEVIVKTQIISEFFEGAEVSYSARVAYCPECGEEVYVGVLHDENLKLLYDAYRKTMDIISLDDIKQLTKKYDISVRNLSKILDFGEHAIENFLDGYIPSQSCSDTMKEVLRSEDVFKKKLNCNRHRITEKAYEQAMRGLKNKKLSYECRYVCNMTVNYNLYYQDLLSA